MAPGVGTIFSWQYMEERDPSERNSRNKGMEAGKYRLYLGNKD